ncbi:MULTISPECIES: CDP-alcohol phosphatidyltransferase family protein [unclassified Plantibacter]|uniref:CDP-alcohol phosphatidyltransferase family protein n=1 Tax=unclassified Plantibacter TaxID=2624265 RepID=UPI003D346844
MADIEGNEVSNRILTIPNLLSMLRLALVPVFLILLIQGYDLWALGTLAFSGFTDFLDGFLARKLGQVTKLGQQLDPAADRLYILAALFGLAWRELIPWWLVATILARDFLLIGLGIALHRRKHHILPVIRIGKWGTAMLFVGLPVLMLGAAFPAIGAVATPVGWVCSLVGAALYWCAGIIYLTQTVRIVRAARLTRGRASDTLEREEVDGG